MLFGEANLVNYWSDKVFVVVLVSDPNFTKVQLQPRVSSLVNSTSTENARLAWFFQDVIAVQGHGLICGLPHGGLYCPIRLQIHMWINHHFTTT